MTPNETQTGFLFTSSILNLSPNGVTQGTVKVARRVLESVKF